VIQEQPSQYERTELKDWELGKIKLFLLAGRIESGKSTVATELKKGLTTEFPNAVIEIGRFASGVKNVATEAFGWDGKKDAKGRRLLQVVGTDAGREYNPDIWVKRCYEEIQAGFPPNIIIYDDWRFPNEYDYWLNKPEIGEVYKIRVFRDGEIVSDHLSEKALPISVTIPDYYDYRFDNNGAKNQILVEIRGMLEEIL